MAFGVLMPGPFPHLHIILLCDEDGSRLWPFVGEKEPACLAPAEVGSDGSLLAATVARVSALTDNPLHIVTTRKFSARLEDEILSRPEFENCDVDLIVMPFARGSAFSVALATARVRKMDPAAVVLVLSSNQKVEADDRWPNLMYRAYLAALQDRVAVIGCQQQDPCAGYTYIRKAAAVQSMEDTFFVRLFSADAPTLVARRAQREGALWYAGAFAARAAVLMGEFVNASRFGKTEHALTSNRIAETAAFFAELGVSDLLKKEAHEVIAAMPKTSLEKAVLEASDKLVVVMSTVPFTTLDSLSSLEQTAAVDELDNRCFGNALMLGSRNTTVYAPADGRTVAVLGMQDCMVVDMDNMLLVVDKSHLDEMDGLSQMLKDDLH